MTVETKYHIDDIVWHAICETRTLKDTCEVCYGELTVALILGNGDHVTLPCEFCRNEHETSTGYTLQQRWVIKPEQCKITEVRITYFHDTHQVDYFSNNNALDTKDIFDTAEEAEEHGKRKWNIREKEKALATGRKNGKNKSYTWLAGYHRGRAKMYRKKAEQHDRYVAICKENEENEG